jgi:hypothetical protein
VDSKVLKYTIPFTGALSRAAINSIFMACFTNETTSLSVCFSPSDDLASESDIYSINSNDSSDSEEKGKILDPRLSAHRRVVQRELQSPHCSSGTREKLTKFLSSTTSSPDNGYLSMASDTPSEHSVVQLLSPIEKSRPVLRSYQPDDISEFLASYRDYHHQGGGFRLSLCLSATQLIRFYDSDPIPRTPLDEDVRARLISRLPKWTPEAIDDAFQSSVAMRYSNDSKHSDIAQFSAKDFYRYEDRFPQLLTSPAKLGRVVPPAGAFFLLIPLLRHLILPLLPRRSQRIIIRRRSM